MPWRSSWTIRGDGVSLAPGRASFPRTRGPEQCAGGLDSGSAPSKTAIAGLDNDITGRKVRIISQRRANLCPLQLAISARRTGNRLACRLPRRDLEPSLLNRRENRFRDAMRLFHVGRVLLLRAALPA